MQRALVIEPEELARELEPPGPGTAGYSDPGSGNLGSGNPDLRIFDCRFRLDDPTAGRRLWATDHLPGAYFADLDADLSGARGAATGRHPLPDPRAFIDWCRSHGIDAGSTVVCYDDVGGMFAARLWWLLARWLRHPSVCVLNGGIARWRAEGWPLTTATPAHPAPSDWQPEPDPAAAVAAEDLAGRLVVDARGEERFRGDQEPIDPVAGHVPGARNRPATDNLDADGRVKSARDLRADWSRVLGGRDPTEVVHMCGSGVMACHNVLTMEQAGLSGARVYVGSWSEWIRDPDRPVATGSDDESG